MSNLQEKIGAFPQEPKEQNSVWYKTIYSPVREKVSVKDSHKMYLLFRDMASFTFLFFVCGILLYPIFGATLKSTLTYSAILISEFLLLSFSAQNYAKRFVCNSIAEYLNL